MAPEDLSTFAFKAMTTWGEPEDYKHFLPRILELAATPHTRGGLGFSLDVICGKLERAGWRAWPAPERDAIRAWARALWGRTLTRLPGESHLSVDAVLPVVARLLDDIGPLLEAWRRDEGLGARLQLAELLSAVWPDLARGTPIGGDWAPQHRAAVERWLLEDARRRELEAAFERYLGPLEADPRTRSWAPDLLAEAIDAFMWLP
jgi:hypothetical protein